MAHKNDNFSQFAKHRLIKNTVNWCFSTWVFWNQNNDVEQKHNFKSAKKSKDKKKGFPKRKEDRKPKKRKIDEGKLCNWIFWCCSYHETKAKKKEKERKRQKQGSKRKQKRKTERKGKRTRRGERQRKKNWKRGRPKKAKEKQRETLKNKQKMPFSRGNTRFFVLQSKERTWTKTNQKKQKNNK